MSDPRWPRSFSVEKEIDPPALVAELLDELKPYEDDLGNLQAPVRLYYEDGVLTVEHHEKVKESRLRELVEAHAPAGERERALSELRAQRDGLLAASDWTQLPDAPLSDKARASWVSYREKLRALPEQGDPLEPSWPRPPR